jgi:hypothetical protein
MSCPYFVPTEILAGAQWPHRARLPLGDGWTGHCCAAEGSPSPESPTEDELRDFCNLGYALQYQRKCTRCPQSRDWDAIRVGVVGENGAIVQLDYVCERDFAPVEHGVLTFDRAASQWMSRHSDQRVQLKAEAYLRVWMERHPLRASAAST